MTANHHSREPIRNTCPDIDKVLGSLSRIEKSCKYKDYYTVEDFQNVLDSISYECYGLDTILEQLRKDNEALRSWGKEEAESYDKLEEDYNEIQARMDL